MTSKEKELEISETDWTHSMDQRTARNNLMGLVGSVDEVKEKMADNLEKAMERGVKLEELADHAEKISRDAARLVHKIEEVPKGK